jgi:hypothetical protein
MHGHGSLGVVSLAWGVCLSHRLITVLQDGATFPAKRGHATLTVTRRKHKAAALNASCSRE